MSRNGTRFGAYEITRQIGAGGMGEVWLAKDTVLKREVALKLLPASVAADADRLARFQREAEMLAALNHPHIAQVYGLEEADGVTAIVMELVDGPTLAERIERGPIAPDEAMSIAMQVLVALEAAHAKHIIHRDLKPANIKIRDDGTVKVLDFGISKPIDTQAISGGSPVATTPAVTETGVILGTAAYMSPEQARGKPVDERTDIWAFGRLLFEMLTGQPAFGGEDVMMTLARVLDRPADLSSMPATISPAVRRTIALCLEKDPAQRIADIRDVRLALAGEFDTGTPRSDVAAQLPLWRRALVPGATLLLGAGLAATAALMLQDEPAPALVPPPTRFVHVLPADEPLVSGFSLRTFDLSPDGRRFVYATSRGIYRRELDELEATLIRGTEGDAARYVAFGVRSDEIYIMRGDQGRIERLPIVGGAGDPVVVAESVVDDSTVETGSFQWTSAGDLLIGYPGGISLRRPVLDARPERLIELEDDQQVNGARFLPDGDTVLFALRQIDDQIENSRIVAQSIGTGERSEILPRGYDPRYVESGHVLFMRDGALRAIAFDIDALTTVGEDRLVVDDIWLSERQTPQYEVADNGTLAYWQRPAGVLSSESPQVQLAWLYASGQLELLPIKDPDYINARLSPNGASMAAAEYLGPTDVTIRIFDLRRPDAPTTLIRDGGNERVPFWMNDREVIFSQDGGLFVAAANATGEPRRLTTRREGALFSIPTWISDDGETLIFEEVSAGGGGVDILALDIPSGELTPLLNEPASETSARLSPDERYIAYSSDRDGPPEIFISPFPDIGSDRIKVSPNGGTEPTWDPAGFLYYLDPGMVLMRVAISTDPTLTIGDPEQVSRTPLVGGPLFRPNYHFDFVGRRFLVRQNNSLVTAAGRGHRIVVVERWTDWLAQELPGGR